MSSFARTTRVLVPCVLVAALLATCDGGVAGSGGSLGPKLDAAAKDPAAFGEVADFELVRHDGETVTLADLRGKPWVLGTMFTSCRGPCPGLTRSMRAIQDALEGTDTVLVSLSVDPTEDTPERLTDYARAFDADTSSWWFLTGEEREIYDLIRTSFKMAVARDEAAREEAGDTNGHVFTHDTRLVAIDRTGQVRGWYHHEEQREGLIERMRRLASTSP